MHMDSNIGNSLFDILQKWLAPLIKLGSDPSQRVFWPFILSSLLFALLYTSFSQKKIPLKEQLKTIFSKRGIFHKSSSLDFKLLLFNSALKVFIFPLFIFSMFAVSTEVLQLAHKLIPGFTPIHASPLMKSIAATLMAFLISDFLRFFVHYLMHEIPALRNIHRTHHTAQVLTPFTLFRVHPLESLIGTSRNILTQGLFIGLFVFLFGGKITAIDILGVNLFGFLFNALGSNLRHMPIPISFGLLEYVFISPRMHQIHHSNLAIHQNKNHGVALSIWDHLFGTFYRPSKEELENVEYGLTKSAKPYFEKEATQLTQALIRPLNLPKLLTILKKFKKGVPHEESLTRPFRA